MKSHHLTFKVRIEEQMSGGKMAAEVMQVLIPWVLVSFDISQRKTIQPTYMIIYSKEKSNTLTRRTAKTNLEKKEEEEEKEGV